MPRKNYKGRRVYRGEEWRGRHRLDYQHLPKVLRKLIETDDRPAVAVPSGTGDRAGHDLRPSTDHA